MDRRVTKGGPEDSGPFSLYPPFGVPGRRIPAMNILSILFGFMSIGVLFYYTLSASSPYVLGQSLVSAEIDFGILQLKPITLFMYMFFLSYCFGLNSPISKQRMLRIGDQFFESLYILAWFFVMLSGFEVLYQIVLWSAGLAVQGLQNPDIIVNWWPANPYAINVVFAAKLVVLIFAVSCFSVDYLRRMRMARERIRDNVPPAGRDVLRT
ncbi:MAG: hypothetical protein ABSA92_15035 [Candidatus Bathyarchaeia archaeon]